MDSHVRDASDKVSGSEQFGWLTTEHRQILHAHAESVRLRKGATLSTASNPIRHLYFLNSGLVSLVADGAREIELAAVGREGCIGIDALLGRATPAGSKSVVRVGGEAFRIPVSSVRRIIECDESLHLSLLRYAHQLQTDMVDAHVASLTLTIVQRVARLIFLYSTKAETDLIHITHREIATALGVRRAGVTGALHLLQGARAVRSTR